MRLAERALAAGAAGVVALATTGEPTSLDDDERAAVVAACAEACAANDGVLVVGAGTNDTRTTILRHEALADVPGVAASLAVVPYYVRPSEAAIVRHFQAVAERSPVPLIVYNIPYRTGRGLGADALLELAATDGIAGAQAGRRRHRRRHAARARGVARPVRAPGRRRRVPLPARADGRGGRDRRLCERLHRRVLRHGRRAACAATWRAAARSAEALLPLVQALFAEPSPAVIKAVLLLAGPHPDRRRAHAALPRVAHGMQCRARGAARPRPTALKPAARPAPGLRRGARRCRRPRCGG